MSIFVKKKGENLTIANSTLRLVKIFFSIIISRFEFYLMFQFFSLLKFHFSLYFFEASNFCMDLDFTLLIFCQFFCLDQDLTLLISVLEVSLSLSLSLKSNVQCNFFIINQTPFTSYVHDKNCNHDIHREYIVELNLVILIGKNN